jgi:hypothetical protein
LTLYATPTEVSDAQLVPLRETWKGHLDLIKIKNKLRVVSWP